MSAGPSWARSEELYARAVRLLPGGVNSPVRAMGAIGRDPVFVARGQGAEIEDVDGNSYVDWVCSWGPLIAGHAHPAVVDAVTAAARSGTSFGAPTEAEVALAAEVSDRIPGAEMVRMVNSGHRGHDERHPPRARRDAAARSCSSSPAPTTGTLTACLPKRARGSRPRGYPHRRGCRRRRRRRR